MKETRTYRLRLPRSLKEAVERLSREDQTSINQFVATAVAEKVSALQTARFFASRKALADFAAFDQIMRRRGGKKPREGDEIPARTNEVRQSDGRAILGRVVRLASCPVRAFGRSWASSERRPIHGVSEKSEA
jgi:hypothetical protein